jgi:ankyrin repeat protein
MACKSNCFTLVILVENSKRFRWVFCQLEILRHCLPPSVRHTLDELPESLDETYERVLKEIKKPNRDHARRLLQCLVVAVRPLKVKELAEVLAVDFDDAEGVSKLNPNWRWEDEEQALLTSCSSLIAIVGAGNSRVVQFSHFSVKEFLISTRLADSSKYVSRYHVDLEPAHTILAQACMAVLLQPDDFVEDNSIWRSSSLAEYAAQYWVTHARFKSVSLSLKKAMEYLFDSDKPHFATWLELHNIDIRHTHYTHAHTVIDLTSSHSSLAAPSPPNASPLYYAALCGFQDLVEHLVIKHPQHVNTNGGWYGTPLAVALAGKHFQTAKFLHDNGAHLDVHSDTDTLLYSAAWYGDLEMVQVLLSYEVDVNARGDHGWTALHDAASSGSQLSPDVARILLDHGTDVNARATNNSTPLHIAAREESVEVVRVLLEHGGIVDAEDEEGRTPLHRAAGNGSVELVRMLLEHGADVSTRTKYSSTPLLVAATYGRVEVVQMLIKHGANADVEGEQGRTLLHEAAGSGSVGLVHMLLERGADVNARTHDCSTPLLVATRYPYGSGEVALMLIKHDADVSAKDEKGITPLHRAAVNLHPGWRVELVRVLIEHGAGVNAPSKDGSTPLLMAAEDGSVEVVQMLIKHGADVSAEDEKGRTPLHRAAVNRHPWKVELVRVLIEHGADVNALTKDSSSTPLLMAAENGSVEVVQMLIKHGANAHVGDKDGRTLLHGAARSGSVRLVRVLIEHGVNVGTDKKGRTLLYEATRSRSVELVRMVLEHGADVNARTQDSLTPLLVAAIYGNIEVVRVLLEHGADVGTEDKEGRTPLHEATTSGRSVELVRMLLEHGANVDAEDEEGWTPLHEATRNGSVELVREILEHGADINARTNDLSTPLLMAVKYGNVDVMRGLLEHGANVEAEDEKGRTSFQIASVKGYNDIVEVLSDHGAKGVFSVSTSSLCLPW